MLHYNSLLCLRKNNLQKLVNFLCEKILTIKYNLFGNLSVYG